MVKRTVVLSLVLGFIMLMPLVGVLLHLGFLTVIGIAVVLNHASLSFIN